MKLARAVGQTKCFPDALGEILAVEGIPLRYEDDVITRIYLRGVDVPLCELTRDDLDNVKVCPNCSVVCQIVMAEIGRQSLVPDRFQQFFLYGRAEIIKH